MSNPEQDKSIDTYDYSALERAERRELVLRATDAMTEIFDVEVTIPALMQIADEEEASPARLAARRALRCAASIAREDSRIISAIGEKNIYDYVEGVVSFGASDKLYLELMEKYGLAAEEVTGLYALRELLARQTDGKRQGMPTIIDALRMVGISVQQAAHDPEEALAAFEEAGYITDHPTFQVGDKTITKQLAFPVFYPSKGKIPYRILDDDVDGSLTESITDGMRDSLRYPREESEIDDIWHGKTVEEYLKNLGF